MRLSAEKKKGKGVSLPLKTALLALCLWIAACGGRDGTLKWTEDVKFPDGRIVTLTRYQEFKGPHEIGSSPTESDYWFEFTHPQTKVTIRWEYNRDLATVALMDHGGVPYLLTDLGFGASRWVFKCPNPPYLLFRYVEGKWTRVPLAEIPVKKLRSNMTRWPAERRDLIKKNANHLSVEQTQASYIWSDFTGSPREHPWIIDFNRLEKQTFGMPNCQRDADYLLE